MEEEAQTSGLPHVELPATGGLTAIGPVPSHQKVRDHALVLQSMSVWHVARPGLGGWILLVRDEDYARAARAIDRYEEENKDWPPPRERERLRYPASSTALVVMIGLLAFFVLTGPVRGGSHWFAAGRSVSTLVTTSEPWRAVTALTLHADGPHVVGNAIAGTVFASAVQRRLGPGGGMLAILLAGTLGNVANALYYVWEGQLHLSIGASTAVMGAIGILASTQAFAVMRQSPVRARKWFDYVAPIVGGAALLGTVGASPQSDLGAHGFGFLAGLLVGAGAALAQGDPRPKPRAPKTQVVLGAVALGLVVGAWQLALA